MIKKMSTASFTSQDSRVTEGRIRGYSIEMLKNDSANYSLENDVSFLDKDNQTSNMHSKNQIMDLDL